MIEIISENVEMPKTTKCRFTKKCPSQNINGEWQVVDNETGEIVYKGVFDDVALACLHMNKKYYSQNLDDEELLK